MVAVLGRIQQFGIEKTAILSHRTNTAQDINHMGFHTSSLFFAP